MSRQRYDEQHLREILAHIRAPESLERFRTAVEPRSPRRSWRLPVAAAAAAACLMTGTVLAVDRLLQSGPAPPGVVTSPSSSLPSGPPPVATSPPGRPPTSPPASTPPTGPRSGPATPTSAPAGPGVPPGTRLTIHNGDMHVTTAGAVISDLQVNGTLFVDARDVTLQRVRVMPPNGYFGIRQDGAATNLTVRDTEIIGNRASPAQYGISEVGAKLTVSRTLIRNVDTGIALGAADVTISGSRIDSLTSSSPSGISSNGDTPRLSITATTIINPADAGAAITLAVDAGPQTFVTIENNTLAGGAFALRAGGGGGSHDISVRNNRFSRQIFPTCGSLAPVADWDAAAPGNLWSGNVWADTGAPVTP